MKIQGATITNWPLPLLGTTEGYMCMLKITTHVFLSKLWQPPRVALWATTLPRISTAFHSSTLDMFTRGSLKGSLMAISNTTCPGGILPQPELGLLELLYATPPLIRCWSGGEVSSSMYIILCSYVNTLPFVPSSRASQ